MKWKSRYTAVSIVFLIWLVSYLDRMVMSVAIPYIGMEFSLTPVEMGFVMSAFFAGYALCQIPGGILADKFGAQKVMMAGIFWWSIFTGVTGLVGSFTTMILARVVFGIGEGITPSGTWKTLATWTPVKERGFANSIMLSTNALGPAIAPLFVVAIMAALGWRYAFYLLVIPGLILCFLIWRFLPDNPADKKGITQEELQELQEGEQGLEQDTSAAAKMSFFQVVQYPAVWKSFCIMFFSNTACWGFMTWLPTFLVQGRGFNMSDMGIVASLPFFVGIVGALAGGKLIDGLFANNRRILVCVGELMAALFLYLTYSTADVTMMIVYQTAAGFFIFMCLICVMSLPLTAISKEITGRAMGIVNTAGQLAGFLAPITIGYLVQVSGGGANSFDTAFMYLAGMAVMAALVSLTFTQKKKAA